MDEQNSVALTLATKTVNTLHIFTHSCLIVEMILIQYPKICELPFIHNEQFSSKIIYNETRTYSKNLKGKSWNVKSNPFLRFFNIDLD